jgi:hypothetical protein
LRKLKLFLVFILIGILNFFGFIIYLSSTNLPGGEVGMIPLGIALVSLITAIISIAFILLISLKLNISFLISILIYHIIYFILLIYNGLNPFAETESENIDISIIIIALIIGIGIIVINRLSKRMNIKLKI